MITGSAAVVYEFIGTGSSAQHGTVPAITLTKE